MKYYHATTHSSFKTIVMEGIKTGLDGVVYLCDTPRDSIKFLAIRGISKFVVLEVELPEEEVHESFDHSEAFFQCKAYYYPAPIPLDKILGVRTFELED